MAEDEDRRRADQSGSSGAKSSSSESREDGRPAQDKPGRDDKPAKPNPLKNPTVRVGLAVALAVLAAGALLWWLHARNYQATDDAFVDAHVVRLAPQTSGQVRRVLIADNSRVTPGQLLVEIDPATAQVDLAQAQAARTQAQAQLAAAQGAAIEAQAQAAAARAARDQAQAQAGVADRDYARYQTLQAANPAAVAQTQFDQARAQAVSSRDAARSAAAQIDVAGGRLVAARAQGKTAQAQIDAAQARIAQARIGVGYTSLTAPLAGHIAQLNVAPGSYVQPGQQLMAVVPDQLWITANFKETQLKLMRPGQPVTMKLDACDGGKISAHVDSIQRGAGQAFQLLPPENATGNYVKVVQRVPVKIVFDQMPKDCLLGPGMSVTPRVKVR